MSKLTKGLITALIAGAIGFGAYKATQYFSNKNEVPVTTTPAVPDTNAIASVSAPTTNAPAAIATSASATNTPAATVTNQTPKIKSLAEAIKDTPATSSTNLVRLAAIDFINNFTDDKKTVDGKPNYNWSYTTMAKRLGIVINPETLANPQYRIDLVAAYAADHANWFDKTGRALKSTYTWTGLGERNPYRGLSGPYKEALVNYGKTVLPTLKGLTTTVTPAVGTTNSVPYPY